MKCKVTEKATRPARPDGTCFYCHREIGSDHEPNCVLIKKQVRVRLTVEYYIEAPAHWGPEEIEWHRNGSGWCKDNCIDELEKLRKDYGCLCACPDVGFEVVDATGMRYLDET